MNWQKIFNLIKHRLSQVIGLYGFVLIPIWVMYILNNTILFNFWNALGIIPRSLSLNSLIGVTSSWTMHGNFSHLMETPSCFSATYALFGSVSSVMLTER